MLDTSALIAFTERRHAGVRAAVLSSGARPAVSIITIGELQHGVETAPDVARRRQRQRTLEACNLMTVHDVTRAVAVAYGQLSADIPRKVGAGDRWIAATAAAHGCGLVTFDTALAAALNSLDSSAAGIAPAVVLLA